MGLPTVQDKHEFIDDLIANVRSTILSKLHKVPDDWDGMELRNWIAAHFQRETIGLDRKRKKAFMNEVLVRDL